jgi:hypothetical protein
MARVLLSAADIFASLVLGAIAFGFVFITYPEFMTIVFDRATDLRAWIIAQNPSGQYEAWMRVLLDERQLVFMGFTILIRVVLSVITYPLALLWERPG